MTRGVVYAEAGARPAIEEITLDAPGPNEVQVRVEACGVCHTDLHVVETGGWGMKFPILLGHEGAGVVEEVGEGVTSVTPGDRVVIAWRAPCGDSCRACKRGDPRRCSNNLRAKRRLHRAADGAVLNAVLRCGSFADRVIVHEACAVKMPDELPAEQACLIACGFSTGAGAALWATPVQEGSSVAVIGCGGVGLAAKHSGANAHATVIGIDSRQVAQLAQIDDDARADRAARHARSRAARHEWGPRLVRPPDQYARVSGVRRHCGRVGPDALDPSRFRVHRAGVGVGSKDAAEPWGPVGRRRARRHGCGPGQAVRSGVARGGSTE